jgi:hypothetical protein
MSLSLETLTAYGSPLSAKLLSLELCRKRTGVRVSAFCVPPLRASPSTLEGEGPRYSQKIVQGTASLSSYTPRPSNSTEALSHSLERVSLSS